MSDATISKNRPSKSLSRPARPAPAKAKAPALDRPHQSRADTVQVGPREKAGAPAPSPLLAGLGQNFPPQGRGEAIAEQAKKLVGTSFKGTEEKRCADFVSHVISQSGQKPDGFQPTLLAAEFGRMGADKIKPADFKPGDVVAFNNTWRDSKGANDHTHVGVYVGDGQFVHRPTNQADYLPGSKPGEVIQESIEDYLRRPRSRAAEVTGAYRF